MDRAIKSLAAVVVCAGVFLTVIPRNSDRPENRESRPAGESGDSTKTPRPKRAEKPPVAATDGAIGPLSLFLGPNDLPALDKAWDKICERLEKSKSTIEILIATVPDPKDSRFGYHFDPTLDAIQSAIAKKDYVPDHYWLPWTEGSGASPGDESGSAPSGAAPGSANARAWEREPGVVLFRDLNYHETKKLRLLLLVGETSTWGVHQQQFLQSLAIARRLSGTLGEAESTPIRVVGPFFTGAANSLRTCLEQWAEKRPQSQKPCYFDICTGSATEIPPNFFKLIGSKVTVRFTKTLYSETTLFKEAIAYFDRRAGVVPARKDDVALLIESGTSFGRDVRDRLRKEVGRNIKEIPFPTHISDVEAVLTKGVEADHANVPRLITPVDTIPIPFGEAGMPKDVVPALWPKMSAPRDNLVLAHILSTISAEGVRYVGIVASDTRDKIFLINLINKFCPDVQIFLTSNDLLLTNPEQSHDLQGAIVASTYPLFSQNQSWSSPFQGGRRRLLFSQESDQGYYNATLAQLDDPDLLDYGSPDIFPALGSRARETTPPIWISVVGQHGPWPVEVIRKVPTEENLRSAPTSHHHARDSRGSVVPRYALAWTTAFLGISLGCLVLYSSYRASLPREERGDLPKIPFGGPDWVRAGFRHARSDGTAAPHVSLSEVSDESSPIADGAEPLRTGQGHTHPDERASHRVEPRVQGQFYTLICFTILTIYYALIAKPVGIALLTTVFHAPGPWGGWDLAITLTLPLVATLTLFFLVCAVTASFRRSISPAWTLASRFPGHDRFVAGVVRGRRSLRGFARPWRIAGTVLLTVALLALFTWLVVSPFSTGSLLLEEFFAFHRTVNIVSGLSTLLPLAFTGAAVCLWALCQLNRMRIFYRLRIPGNCLAASESSPFRSVARRGRRLDDALTGPYHVLTHHSFAVLVVLVTAFFLTKIYAIAVPTVEGQFFDHAFVGGFAVVCLLTAVEFARFHILRRRLTALYDELARVSSWWGTRVELPPRFSTMFGRVLSELDIDHLNLSSVVQQLDLAEGRSHSRSTSDSPRRDDVITILGRLSSALSDQVQRLEEAKPEGHASPIGSLVTTPGSPHPDAAETDAIRAASRSAAETYVAMMVVLYASQYAVQLRNIGAFLVASPLLLLMATIYPFEPERFIDVFLWVSALLTYASLAFAYVQFDRHEFVSWVAGTKAHEFTLDWRTASQAAIGILPLVGVLLTQFPDVSDFLYNYLGPIFRSLR
jgi:hypothetical protein